MIIKSWISFFLGIGQTPFKLLKINTLQRYTMPADLPQGIFLIIKTDQCPRHSVQLQRGVEASDTGEIAGVGEQDGIPGTVDGVILHEPIWYLFIEAVCEDRIERPALLRVA